MQRNTHSCDTETMKKYLLLLLLPFSIATAANKQKCPDMAPRQTPQEYCNNYARLAIEQMRKYNVPASITLAQGMLESGYGSSYLAVVANNHFGIKASSWKGPVERCDDDAKNEAFCSFSSVEEGYEYHSTFLIRNGRYASLFKLNLMDYKGWAKGLQAAHYATSDTYAQRLISLIEDNQLYAYDRLAVEGTTIFVPSNGGGQNGTSVMNGRHNVYKTKAKKGRLYVVCNEGDDIAQIAMEFGINKSKMLRNNDMSEGHQLHAGDIIYLQNKQNKADEPNLYYTVKSNDSLWKIAQRYCVTVKSLARRNKLKTYEVYEGQVLKLR